MDKPRIVMTPVTRADLCRDLRELGLTPGETALLHSSLKSIGRVRGGADAVIDAFREALGPGGTLLAPTITGRPEHSAANPPVFDVRNTPGWTGLIPNTLWRRAGTLRSLHPTHSVAALGARAPELTAAHHFAATPCGEGSPYLRLAEGGGTIYLVGVGLECNTMFHTAEELAECGYHMQDTPALALITGYDGVTMEIPTRLHQWGTPRRFANMEALLLARGAMRMGRLGQARVLRIEAGPMLALTLEALKLDPAILLDV